MLITDTQTHTHTDTQTHTHTHRPNAKNVIFGFRKPLKSVNPSKSPFRKFYPKTVLSLLCMDENHESNKNEKSIVGLIDAPNFHKLFHRKIRFNSLNIFCFNLKSDKMYSQSYIKLIYLYA